MIIITTEKQFNYLWAKLCDNYNVSYDKTSQKRGYFYKSLKQYPFRELDESLQKIMETNIYFPNLAEIMQSTKNLMILNKFNSQVEVVSPTEAVRRTR